MPTYTVGPSGRDYTTITAAIAALPADLRGLGIHYIDVYDGTYNESVLVNNIVGADSDDYLHIRPASGQNPVINSDMAAAGYAVRAGCQWFRFGDINNGLFYVHPESGYAGNARVIRLYATNQIVGGVVVDNPHGTNHGGIIGEFANSTIEDCLAYDLEPNFGDAYVFDAVTVQRCTAYNVERGVRGRDELIDCAIFDMTTGDCVLATPAVTFSNVATSDTTGTAGLQSLLAIDQYTDPANGDFTFKAGNVLRFQGTSNGNIGITIPGQAPVTDPILVGDIPNQSAEVGQAFSLDLTNFFYSPSEDTLTYAVTTGSLPAGLSLNGTTGIISGTPTTDGTSAGIVITATETLSTNTVASNAFDFGVSAALFRILSLTPSAPRPGDSVVVALENASATGKTAEYAGQAITVTAQDDSSITVTWPTLHTGFTGTLNYNDSEVSLDILDGVDVDSIQVATLPPSGWYFFEISFRPLDGSGLTDSFTDTEAGDFFLGEVTSGSVGNINTDTTAEDVADNTTIEIWIFDVSLNAWSSTSGTITLDVTTAVNVDFISFAQTTDAALNSSNTSESKQITGPANGETIPVSGITGGTFQYSTDGGTNWSSTTDDVNLTMSATLFVRFVVTASGSASTTVSALANIGGLDVSYAVTTVASVPSVSISLSDITGSAQASLSSIKWAWYDSTDQAALGAVVDSGTAETTNTNGVIDISFPNSGLVSGQSGSLMISLGSRTAWYVLAVS